MSLTDRFIARLEELKAGDRGRLRQLAGKPLDETVDGFDLFTGLWWPLRQTNQQAPERRSAWLVAKLYGAFALPHIPAAAAPRERPPELPAVLGRAERREKDEKARERFCQRFDALLLSPLSRLEPHLRWALSVARNAAAHGERGIDWVTLLDNLSKWDRHRGIQEKWAEQYLNHATKKGR